MTRLIVFLAMIVVSGGAQANCQWVDRPTADRALSILSGTTSVVLGDQVGPEPVPPISLVAAPSYTESWDGGPRHGLMAHGDREIHIDQVYFRSADGAYVNLGLLVGCAGASVPPRLPDLPSVEAADRSGAPVPAISYPRFLGLIDIPSFSWYLPEADRKPVTLMSGSSSSSPVRSIAQGWHDLPHDEMGYEETAALVLEESQGWYRIGTVDGQDPPTDRRWAIGWYDFASTGSETWLAPQDVGEFRSYEVLIADRLTYLGDRWDGLLSAEPHAAAPVSGLAPQWRESLFDRDRIAVLVHDTRWVDDRLWARVEVQWPGECGGFMPIIIAEGWVPAHTAAGQPVVRYYSRGC